MKVNCWNYIDTRSKSGKIAHQINIKQHFKHLANAKNVVVLNEPDEIWARKNKALAEAQERAEKQPPGAAFEKFLATSPEFEEVRKNVIDLNKIKNAPPKKQDKPATLAFSKALSKNKSAATGTTEKTLMEVHEKTKKTAQLKRVQEEIKKEQ